MIAFSFDIQIFARLGSKICAIRMFRSFNRCFPWLFVLVLRVSSTRTRTRRYGIEYEYHFIEYECDKSQNSATSKAAATSSINARSPEAINSPGNGINEGLLGGKMKSAYVVTDLPKGYHMNQQPAIQIHPAG